MRRTETNPRIESFPPIAGRGARILILGSMPGKASLAAGEYYAHPQNRFWTILGEVLGAGPGLAYTTRIRVLKEHRVALWDVLSSCVRASSLDSDIEPESIVPNDIAGLLKRQRGIERIAFNGQKAAQVFRQHVAPNLVAPERAIECRVLPSTSPANASVPYATKLAAWRDALIG